MYVKICGLCDAAMARCAIEAGADAVGVVMSPGRSRHASREEAEDVVRAARHADPRVDTVLVTDALPADEAAAIAAELGFDVLQLHGGYGRRDFEVARLSRSRVWRATSLAANPGLVAGDFGEERLLVDGARPGSGEPWDPSLVRGARLGPQWILAGGLSPENVAAAIRSLRPSGVDVSSGVESSAGVKDPERIEAFLGSVRAVELRD